MMIMLNDSSCHPVLNKEKKTKKKALLIITISITSNIYHVPVYTKQDFLQLFASSFTTHTDTVRNDLYSGSSTIGHL